MCGADDVKEYADDFRNVVKEFGGVSSFYQDGSIIYRNGLNASWEENSIKSVKDADICVFVIREKTGRITWEKEFITAYCNCIPLLILCFNDTHNKYLNNREYKENINEKRVVETIELLDSLYGKKQTPVCFGGGSGFMDVLRSQLSNMIREGLRARAETLKLTNSEQAPIVLQIYESEEAAANDIYCDAVNSNKILVFTLKGNIFFSNPVSKMRRLLSEKRGDLRFILLNNKSLDVKKRRQELKNVYDGKIQEDIESIIDRIISLQQNNPDIKLALTDDLMRIKFHIFDDALYLGFRVKGKISAQSQMYKIGKDCFLYVALCEQFEDLWLASDKR